MLNIGDLAPDFELTDQFGDTHKLSDYRGKKVVLYFYPKDDTPGCTKEACGFRDNFQDYRKRQMVVLGVSKDSTEKHAKFSEKYSLPFTLLSDNDTKVSQTYGVWALKKMMGKEFYGINRTTFIIDEDGKILRVYEKVKPEKHAEEILADLE
ncbi:MAG: thioredoxin-dependent thiol peroxidase [Chloroflexi bacterium]|jgi:peroxiredoxin Q/BCP|nr:thioredoxin-dependent thiol peroxidase [Chloroflexota bacterium]